MLNSPIRWSHWSHHYFFFFHTNCLQWKSAWHIFVIVLLALVCISNCFGSLVVFLFTPAVSLFLFSFCIFITALNLTSFLLPFAPFIPPQLYPPMCSPLFIVHCRVRAFHIWHRCSLKRVRLCLQINCGCLKFTDWEMELMILDRRAADCHMALTPGAALLPPASRRSDTLFIYHVPCKTRNYLSEFDCFW